MGKNKRKKKRIKKLIRSLFLLALIFAGLVSFCLFTPFFNLSKIAVTGCERLSESEVIEAAELPLGENIYKISKRKTIKKLSALPEIEDVKISRIPFSKIKIKIKETHPAFVFKTTDGYAEVDPNGKVMNLRTDIENSELPQILGIEAENSEISKKITVQDTIKFDIIMENLSLLREKGIISEMQSIDFSDLSSTEGYLKSGTKVIFGKLTDLDYKLSVLLAIMPQIDNSPGAYIDLTTPSNAFYGRIEEEKDEAEDSSISSDSQKAENEETSQGGNDE